MKGLFKKVFDKNGTGVPKIGVNLRNRKMKENGGH